MTLEDGFLVVFISLGVLLLLGIVAARDVALRGDSPMLKLAVVSVGIVAEVLGVIGIWLFPPDALLTGLVVALTAALIMTLCMETRANQ